MSDRMTPVPFGTMMEWILKDEESYGSIFGVRFPYFHRGKTHEFLGEKIETPFGPAAGPHTQLAQNIVAAYAAGSRFFELKTVQTLDGEDLPVSKPCIDARDECYNVEWSTELRVPEAMDEYIKAWYALKLLAKEFGFGSANGFMFNMSVGYDLEGIKSAKIDGFIEGLRDASGTAVWKECEAWAKANLSRFETVDAAYIDEISPNVCGSITLSTLHGCPPQEIERIASYLIEEKKLNTFIKCNPTLLGYEFARKATDELGFGYIAFDDHHFKADLQYKDAVPMLRRLSALAEKAGVGFGVKLTNTFPVDNPKDVMAGDEMYMSGRSLFPLTAEVARRLAKDFDGKLRISWSGGADFANVGELYAAGIWPITIATTLLKPGGYQRCKQIAEELSAARFEAFAGIDTAAVEKLAKDALENLLYRKPIKPAPSRKLDRPVPLTDCFIAPCTEGCPINQDIPEYVALVGRGEYEKALAVILEKNPLPFITGTICNHRCTTKCTRNFYEQSVLIRQVKLEAAENGIEQIMPGIAAPKFGKAKAAIIGGGPAGLAAAYFLARAGIKPTVYEKGSVLGGVVRKIIPDFRIGADAIDRDVEIVRAMGAEFVLNAEKTSVEALKQEGYDYVILANGAWKHGELNLEKGDTLDVFDFLADFKATNGAMKLGKNVVVIGGGNTAMDAARAAKRVKGVQNVYLVYRRTKQYMPADEEELELALHDGVIFKELLAPLALENGKLACAKMVLGDPDASGRRSPVQTDAREEVPADVVITAVGESVETALFETNGVKLDAKKKVVVDAETLETNVSCVYVAGDARRGPATVVEAIADAARIADAIAAAEGAKKETAARAYEGDSEEVRAKKGILGFADELSDESERCLECHRVCENCVDVCPNRANVSVKLDGDRQPQIVHVDAMCNECGNCTTFCPWRSSPYKDKFTLFSSERDFEDSENSGFLPLSGESYKIRLKGETFTAALGDKKSKLPAELCEVIRAATAQIPLGKR
ncbi:putative selenate reductase subunit YgfK [Synergistaceae bacterium OttesenSCG-928-D05]|nr:putative selenate reductase subunit YgfK [Synergistaceae bacterium OttesenSCG-928-D05]